MNIGIAKITLRLFGCASLKDKRRVVVSICQRMRRQFGVAVAEVEMQDSPQTAVIGITCVSNSVRHADRMLDSVIDFVESERPDSEIIYCEKETVTGF